MSDLCLHCLLRFVVFQITQQLSSRKKDIHINTVFDLITAHTPISAQSSNSIVYRLQPVYFCLPLHKGICCEYPFELHWLAIQMSTHNICFYKENQKKKKTHNKHCIEGWSGGAKVLCILHHWGVQLILAYSWARPAILVVGKGRGGMFLFLLFLYFLSCSSFFPVPLFHLLYSLFYLFSPFLWETTQNDPQGLTCR